MKITSLEQLKKWNRDFTDEKPILLEWFLDWFFDDCLKNYNYKFCSEAYDEFLVFTQICEGIGRKHAIERVNSNLIYWYRRASKPIEPFKTFFNRKLVETLGV